MLKKLSEKQKESLKTFGIDTARMLGFNLLAIIVASVILYGIVFGMELYSLFSSGIEAYAMENYGVERIAFYVIFYDLIDQCVEQVGGIAMIVSYVLMLGSMALYIRHRRRVFTYENMESNWNERRKAYIRDNLIGYFIISLPANIYFLINRIDGVYQTPHIINTLSRQRGLGVPDWISTFFAPQAAFYELTHSLLFGLVLNFVIYYGVTSILYLIPKKETVLAKMISTETVPTDAVTAPGGDDDVPPPACRNTQRNR